MVTKKSSIHESTSYAQQHQKPQKKKTPKWQSTQANHHARIRSQMIHCSSLPSILATLTQPYQTTAPCPQAPNALHSHTPTQQPPCQTKHPHQPQSPTHAGPYSLAPQQPPPPSIQQSSKSPDQVSSDAYSPTSKQPPHSPTPAAPPNPPTGPTTRTKNPYCSSGIPLTRRQPQSQPQPSE